MEDNLPFKFFNMIPKTILSNLKNVKNKLGESYKIFSNEINLLESVFSKIQQSSLTYEKSIFSITENFQKKISDVKDDKLSQIYQMVVNFILHYIDDFNKPFLNLKSYVKKLKNFDLVFSDNVKQVEFIGESNINLISSQILNIEKDYKNYFNLYLDLSEGEQKNSNSKVILEKFEKDLKKKNEDIKKIILDTSEIYGLKLENLSQMEKNIKKEIKSISKNFSTETNKKSSEIIQEKIKNIDQIFPNFKSIFQILQEESNLKIHSTLTYQKMPSKFISAITYFRLKHTLERDFGIFFYEKMIKLRKYVPNKLQVLLIYILETIFFCDELIHKDIVNKLGILFGDDVYREYFFFSLFLHKIIYSSKSKFKMIHLKKNVFSNIKTVSKLLIMNCDETKNNIDYFMIYHFFKFCLMIRENNNKHLIEYFKNIPLLNKIDFWVNLAMNLKEFSKKNKRTSDIIKQRIGNFDIMKNMKMFKNTSNEKFLIFEELSGFLFKMKLAFEIMSDILIEIGFKLGIDFETVKLVIQKNEYIFINQIKKISSNNIYQKTLSKSKITKNEKVYIILKNTISYIPKAEIKNFLYLLKDKYKKKIILNILYKINFKNKKIRNNLILYKINKKLKKTNLKNNFSKSETDNTIALDVKRTYYNNIEFDHNGLEKILYNISDKEIGDFAYYQGMNYITNYFYITFEKDELKTYNIVVSVLYDYFIEYVDKSLENLKKLFFYLKKFIKIYLPDLSNFFENEIQLDTDIVFASWCLTLFTTCTQYTHDLSILDKIMDIFIAKGWVGFFQVIMIILEKIKKILFEKSYEEVLVFLCDIPKNGFKILEGIELKKKVLKYKKINKVQIAIFECEYFNINETLQSFWVKINNKYKMRDINQKKVYKFL